MALRHFRCSSSRRALTISALLGAAAPLPVWAQDAANSVAVGEAVVVGNAATDGENAPDEIIVTAQKQAANIQDVPVSVAAIGSVAKIGGSQR